MDLVANGPMKGFFRAGRCMSLLHEFRDFKDLYDSAPANAKPVWAPPAPTLVEGLTLLFDTWKKGPFSEAKFADSLKRCFVKVGLWPDAEGRWYNWTGTDMRPQLETLLPSADRQPTDSSVSLLPLMTGIEFDMRNVELVDDWSDEEGVAERLFGTSAAGAPGREVMLGPGGAAAASAAGSSGLQRAAAGAGGQREAEDEEEDYRLPSDYPLDEEDINAALAGLIENAIANR